MRVGCRGPYGIFRAGVEHKQPAKILLIAAGGIAVSGGLVAVGLSYPAPAAASSPAQGAFFEFLKLVAAAMSGIVLTAVHRYFHTGKPLSPAIEQAQILLAVAGALMMILISDSLARAFGVAGAAGIVRFRTPVDDPKDATILFLLLGLGMSCGLGMFSVAGVGTAFLCLFIAVLNLIVTQKPRTMILELVAAGPNFPVPHVQNVLNAYQIHFEPREVSHGKNATVTYQVSVPPDTSLEFLNDQLMADGAGIQSVSWEEKKWMN